MHYQRLRGLKQNGSAQGTKAQEYADIERLPAAATGHFDSNLEGAVNRSRP
jgi:hypothetical protein